MDLNVALESVCRLILRLREYEAMEPDDDPEVFADDEDGDGDDGRDDEENPAEEEIRALVDELAEDEQVEIIALALVGRGTYEAGEWAEALDAAAEESDEPVEWLLEQPALSVDLESGLAAFDLSCDGLGTVV